MKFSILVPMYNVEKFLSKSIESVLDQSYNNFELILVNDGSTDNSLFIAKKYQKSDERIIIIDQKNKGLVQARRIAINKASGDYILFLDSDDLLINESLSLLNNHIKNKNSDLVLFKYRNIDENGEVWKSSNHLLESHDLTNKEILNLFLTEYKFTSIWSKCYKANLLKDDFIDYDIIGHLNMHEDRLQSLYGLYHAKNISFLNEYLYLYRLNPNSLTQKFSEKSIFDSVKVYDAIYKSYKNKLDDDIVSQILVGDFYQVFGKYLRWYNSNPQEKKKRRNVLDKLTKMDFVSRSSPHMIGVKNKFFYNVFVNKNMFVISLINIINMIRIRKQSK